MESELSFLIIDDNVIDILIYKKILGNTLGKPWIMDFKDAEKGLKYIKENYSKDKERRTILLLDLNMPEMNGWEFLVQFDKLAPEVKSQVKVFILSFYVNAENEKLAALNPNVEMILSKPLTKEKIAAILSKNAVKGM